MTTLDVFNGHNGKSPFAGLVQAADGDFYGTTGEAIQQHMAQYSGTVNRIDAQGALTTLHRFIYDSEGDSPGAGASQRRELLWDY